MAQQNKSFFIAFEGIDGAGKSTQANMLADALRKEGSEVIKTREPGGTKTGDEIREILLNATKPLSTKGELLLMMAARTEHLEELIKPSLDAGKIVITDRFSLSTYAYQGYGFGTDLQAISQLEEIVVGSMKPNITFLIDIPEETALNRAKQRQQTLTPDRFEMMELKFFRRVRDGFLKMAEGDTRIITLDGTKSAEELHQEILSHLEDTPF